MKTLKSNSWAVHIRNILLKYDLEDPVYYLNERLPKGVWFKSVLSNVTNWWKSHIETAAALYPSLKYLHKIFTFGKMHPVLQILSRSAFESTRIPVRFRLLTGTLRLQATRAKFNQNNVDPTCVMCRGAPENVEHFLFDCPTLAVKRDTIMGDIMAELCGFKELSPSLITNHDTRVQFLIDFSTHIQMTKKNTQAISRVEFHIRRLIYSLFVKRHSELSGIT